MTFLDRACDCDIALLVAARDDIHRLRLRNWSHGAKRYLFIVAFLVGVLQVNRAYLIRSGLLRLVLDYNHVKALSAVGFERCRGLFVSDSLGYLLEHLSYGEPLSRRLLPVNSHLDFGACLGSAAVGFFDTVEVVKLCADIVGGGFELL